MSRRLASVPFLSLGAVLSLGQEGVRIHEEVQALARWAKVRTHLENDGLYVATDFGLGGFFRCGTSEDLNSLVTPDKIGQAGLLDHFNLYCEDPKQISYLNHSD